MTLSSAPVEITGLDDLLGELSRTLWKQRGLIEVLQYRLEIQQMVLSSGRENRLQLALEEVEAAMEDLRRSERSRDQVVRQCAQLLSLPETASLAELRHDVGEPWDALLAEHQDALLAMVAQTERIAASNRELAQRGANESRAVIDAVTGTTPTGAYGPSSGRNGLSRPALLDRRA